MEYFTLHWTVQGVRKEESGQEYSPSSVPQPATTSLTLGSENWQYDRLSSE